MTVPRITLNDGNTIPQLGFGVWQVSHDDIVPAVSTALQVGYRHIDTAAAYDNEEGVGQAIADSGIPRDELFITTKLWNDKHKAADTRKAAKESLRKLGLDYLDLYLIHWPATLRYGDTYIEAYQTMEELKAEGLLRSIGVSNFTVANLDALQAVGASVPAVNQIETHPTFNQAELSRELDIRGIKLESWSPLGQSQDLQHEVITALADTLGRTPAQVILRWHIQKGFIVIPKSITPARIAENFDVFDFELSSEQMASIDGLDTGNRIGGNPDTADF